MGKRTAKLNRGCRKPFGPLFLRERSSRGVFCGCVEGFSQGSVVGDPVLEESCQPQKGQDLFSSGRGAEVSEKAESVSS